MAVSAASDRPRILVIDDEVLIHVMAKNILGRDYEVYGTETGEEGVKLAVETEPSLILLDIRMIGMDGFQVLAALKADERTSRIPVMFMTADSPTSEDEEFEVRGFKEGASDFVRKPFVPEVLSERARRLVELYHLQSHLAAEVERQTRTITHLTQEVMLALAKTVDAKDHYTNGHSQRVATYSRMIAQRLGKDDAYCERIYYMGLLHDVGKIGVSGSIINKPTRLTAEEFDEIKTHTTIGYDHNGGA